MIIETYNTAVQLQDSDLRYKTSNQDKAPKLARNLSFYIYLPLHHFPLTNVGDIPVG